VLKNFFVLANWHLLWFLTLVALAAAIPGLRAERWRRIAAMFVGSCLLMLFCLFFFTDAQRWAEQYTSINRVFLHFVPVLLFWIVTVFAPASASAARPPSARTAGPSAGGEQPQI
jgi:cell division protein FtsW (lipid II flippase)